MTQTPWFHVANTKPDYITENILAITLISKCSQLEVAPRDHLCFSAELVSTQQKRLSSCEL